MLRNLRGLFSKSPSPISSFLKTIVRFEGVSADFVEEFFGGDAEAEGGTGEAGILFEGAAFVCGEETALIESLEGSRGMPRLKPPFPAQEGYWHKPSNINNVETFANVAWIIENGGQAFSAMGTEDSKGTKVFALTGKVKRGGDVYTRNIRRRYIRIQRHGYRYTC